jgi:hypothetical protein
VRRFFDALFGRTRPTPARTERIFAMSTAYITLQAQLGLEPDRFAGITFRPVTSGYFDRATSELHSLLELSTRDTGATFRTHKDNYGFEWIILEDADFEDLVATIHIISTTLIEEQFGDRLLAAVFRFFDRDRRKVYWFHNFKRGLFYPFIPTGPSSRDNAYELRLQSVMGRELPVDPQLESWYPMWEIPF